LFSFGFISCPRTIFGAGIFFVYYSNKKLFLVNVIITMSFTASFTALQNEGGNVVISDTSNYSVLAKTQFISRSLKLYRFDGSLYATIPFSYSAYATDAVAVRLGRDFTLRVVLELTPLVTNIFNSYTAYRIFNFTYYADFYLRKIAETASLSSLYRSGGNFYNTISRIILNKKGAEWAATAQLPKKAQLCVENIHKTINSPILT
jgi:hypothetical protein